MINFSNSKSLDVVDFSNQLLTNYEQILFSNCTHLPNTSPLCVDYKTNYCRNDASSYINQKTPSICKETTVKETGGVWYDGEIREAKKVMRKAEKFYHKYGNGYYKTQFRIAKQAKCSLVMAAKCTYYR